jgi:hypothetical protein
MNLLYERATSGGLDPVAAWLAIYDTDLEGALANFGEVGAPSAGSIADSEEDMVLSSEEMRDA